MKVVAPCELPPSALLQRVRLAGAFADCYTTEVTGPVTVADLIEAFYTTRIFKLERLLIRLMASQNSTDLQARELAAGHREDFAVWTVEQRLHDQVLLADRSGRTKSWFMVSPPAANPSQPTRLYFGSAVLPRIDQKTGEKGFGTVFRLLLGFHAAYSRALLRAAVLELQRRTVHRESPGRD